MGKKIGKKPDFNVRARVGDHWTTIGVAWKLDDGNISVRLNVVPVGAWDGGALMLPPLEDEADKDQKN